VNATATFPISCKWPCDRSRFAGHNVAATRRGVMSPRMEAPPGPRLEWTAERGGQLRDAAPRARILPRARMAVVLGHSGSPAGRIAAARDRRIFPCTRTLLARFHSRVTGTGFTPSTVFAGTARIAPRHLSTAPSDGGHSSRRHGPGWPRGRTRV